MSQSPYRVPWRAGPPDDVPAEEPARGFGDVRAVLAILGVAAATRLALGLGLDVWCDGESFLTLAFVIGLGALAFDAARHRPRRARSARDRGGHDGGLPPG